MAEPARTCTICKKTKPESKFKVRKGKYTNQCKDCINAQSQQYNKRDQAKQQTAARQRAWVARNPEKYADKIKKDTERERHKRGKNSQ